MSRRKQGASWTRALLVVVGVFIACLAAFLLFNSVRQKAVKKLDAQIATLKKEYDGMRELIDAREQWMAKLEDCAMVLKRYDLPVKDPDLVPPELTRIGVHTVAEEDREAKLIRDLSTLAEQSGCELVQYKPQKYQQRRIEADPRKIAAAKPDEDKKKAEESWKKLTDEQRSKIEQDQKYSENLRSIAKFATIAGLDLRLRGRMEDIQRFVCGLSKWPTANNFVFPHLIMISNIQIRVVAGSGAEPLPPGVNPVLEADLDTRVFTLQELDFSPKKKAGDAPSGSATGKPGSSEAAPAGRPTGSAAPTRT
jgi:hypothetical protein